MGKSTRVGKNKGGRPVTTGTSPYIALRLPTKLLTKVDTWQRKHNAQSRSDAIRRLIERGLADDDK